jgi:hypothetical protein
MLGRYCLYVSLTENETYILGVFPRDEDMQAQHIHLEDGETLLWAGDYRIFHTSPNGDIGIYTIKKNTDNTLEKEPVFEYSKKDERIFMAVDNFVIGMLGASTRGNIIMEQDSQGNFVYIFEGKTRLDDKNVRFRLRISNPIMPIDTENVKISPDGILELMVDTIPTPVSGPIPIESSTNPIMVKMGAQRSGLGGISITYGELCEVMMGLNLSDGGHLFSIKAANGAKINLDNYGGISAETKIGSKVTLKPDGITEITSPAGVSISISKTGIIKVTSPKKVRVESPKIELKGEININTLPGKPGFCKQALCPMTGAPLTTNKAGSSGV